MLVRSDFKHGQTLKQGKKYQYWVKIAAAFRVLVVFYVFKYSRRSAEFGFEKKN